jgi:DNA ligase D-like protein (predicted 3'-phosphoesterase)
MAKSNKKKLEAYRSKRNFRRTQEPAGEGDQSSGDQRRFVIQKHAARTLHYDFRLEVDGVLKSWAVPKGPSTDPREKRLAVATEDHPLDYADFEGVIAEGEYGGGTVMVWDRGTYRNLKEEEQVAENEQEPVSMSRAIEDGHLTVWLEGEKLKGGYALIRMQGGGKNDQWLLIKMHDEHTDARRNPTSTQNKSVISGRTMAEIAREDAQQD